MKSKIALFVNGWNGENIDSFIDGLKSYYSNNDVDLFVFTSYTLTINSIEENIAEDSIYSLPDVSFFDAVIIYGSGINSDEIISHIIKKCEKAEVPFVLQGIESDKYNTVTVDSYVGLNNLCEHLITQHNVKDVTYIAGAAENADSNFRMNVVKETLKKYGYSLNEDNIYYANWESRYIQKYLFEKYFDKKTKLPDAFICANDQMAMFLVLFLEQLGYKVPGDTIVSGFDNLNDGKICYPSLATVDQRYHEQGAECAKLAKELIYDKKLKKQIIVPCVAMPGESCGCFDCNGETELRKKLGALWLDERFTSENMQGRESHLDMCIMSNPRYENIHQTMNDEFCSSIGEETEDFHIYINPQYQNLEYMNEEDYAPQERFFEPVLDVLCARTGGAIYTDDVLDIKNLLLGYSSEGKAKTYIFKSLKIQNFVTGYMVMGYKYGAFKRRVYLDLSSRLDRTLVKYQRNIDDYNKTIRVQEQANEFLRQTVEALATAVDAKDTYTNGHSNRVAKYSRMIAKESGMTEKECDDVYLAGLLHDVGKIGIDDSIINKKGKLTDEEYAIIKNHPELGGQILSKIVMSPELSVGARFHHERYDGNGYPENLKGEDIPRIARIIAVADAYDAMTSMRSYRGIIPQMHVREELIKGIGTQFDPVYSKIMIGFLDKDLGYTLKESRTEEVFGSDLFYEFDEYKSKISAGIRISDCPVSIKIKYKPIGNVGQPTLLFYDSADARYYLEDNLIAEEMDFVEYACVDIDGSVYPDYIRKVAHKEMDTETHITNTQSDNTIVSDIYIVKYEDHVLLKITTDNHTKEITFALYDASRFVYLALTGESCTLDILDVDISSDAIGQDYIPRITEKITYIEGKKTGDIPNVQIDSWIANRSEILKVDDFIDINFHTISLPSSRRIWHCPIVALFTSDDGKINGENYKELAFIRLDGEIWCDSKDVSNESMVSKNESFENWNIWKRNNKSGVTCKLSITHSDNIIDLQIENSGLEIRNKTILPDNISNIYFYLTGDQCALTDIHIK